MEATTTNNMSNKRRNNITNGLLALLVTATVVTIQALAWNQFIVAPMDITTSLEDDDGDSSTTEDQSKQQSQLSFPEPLADGSFDPEQTRHVIQYVVAGWPKTGTTFLLKQIFGRSEAVYMGDAEIRELNTGDIEGFLSNFRAHFQNGQSSSTTSSLQLGFKSPNTILNFQALASLSNYFPDTKIIITLRSPVSWFQSWYNYKLRSLDMPHPKDMVGHCNDLCQQGAFECPNKDLLKAAHGCTGMAAFHIYLSLLGYTPMNTEEELQLLGITSNNKNKLPTFDFSQTQVFVTELDQLGATDSDILYTLFDDMEDFLNIPRKSLPRLSPKPRGQKEDYSERKGMTEEKKNQVLDICSEEHTEIRQQLLEYGRDASQWLERYFLKSPNVVVSQRESLIENVRSWAVDPCSSVKTTTQE